MVGYPIVGCPIVGRGGVLRRKRTSRTCFELGKEGRVRCGEAGSGREGGRHAALRYVHGRWRHGLPWHGRRWCGSLERGEEIEVRRTQRSTATATHPSTAHAAAARTADWASVAATVALVQGRVATGLSRQVSTWRGAAAECPSPGCHVACDVSVVERVKLRERAWLGSWRRWWRCWWRCGWRRPRRLARLMGLRRKRR